ncbi:hypothetical protein LUW75_05640 [Streptomyces sp. MRC013]|uniref:hypothetical protein n=1 Tax=Streptomyces sp. MRC013 TaxID=2898276 RepID=UPI002026CB18|nr:hypothetical protein [Streptomyces sp. MRC013]URM92612.1 hypothetical protein LUW75_05640 [Streptomyces sp. MRC013]
MRGDGTQPEAADDGAARGRGGPRHAAPRRSLLNRIQAPAGKALALAAMPTAVFVGMSLTPRPALADEKDVPFAPGPCVTRSDQPQEPDEPKPSPSPSAPASPSVTPSPGGGAEAGKPSGKPTAGGPSAKPTGEPQAGTLPSPAPTPTASRDPLDPLGVGRAVEDLFDGLTGRREPTGAATPTPAAPTPVPPAPEAPEAAGPAEGPGEEPSGKPAPPAEPAGGAADGTERAVKEAADRAGARVEELPEEAKGLEPRKDGDVPDDAKPRFPCPTPDPRALAEAEPEPGIPHVADEPWRLESTRLTLRGLKYHGVVEVRTGSGTVKKALKFTASEVDIKDLHQLTVHGDGRTGHVTSRPGSTSTIRGGTVTMYTEELKGNLFGFAPITFSPRTPPPLDVPFAFFTDVEVTQAAQFGGTLTVPGLRNFIEG